jgi:predicted nucleic acid-binding protein
LAILDAYALIAVLRNEPPAAEVLPLLRSSEASIAAPNLAETYDRVLRLSDTPLAEVDELIGRLTRIDRLRVIPMDVAIARRTGELRARHYARTEAVSLADCAAAATAERHGEALATPDVRLAKLAREIGVEVIALPDSTGKRP